MSYYTKVYQTDLPHRAKLVYIYLHDRMDKEKMAWPGLNTIVKDLSLSKHCKTGSQRLGKSRSDTKRAALS